GIRRQSWRQVAGLWFQRSYDGPPFFLERNHVCEYFPGSGRRLLKVGFLSVGRVVFEHRGRLVSGEFHCPGVDSAGHSLCESVPPAVESDIPAPYLLIGPAARAQCSMKLPAQRIYIHGLVGIRTVE